VDFDWSLMFMPLLFFFGFGLLISRKDKEHFTFKCPILEKRKKSLKEVKSYKVKTNDGKKVTSLVIVTVILFLLFLFPFIAARENFSAKAGTGIVSWQETVNQYKSSIAFDPLCAEYHYDLAHFNFEILIPSAPDPTQFVNQAINQYNAAIKHCPEFFLYHFELAKLYLQTGNEKAIDEFTKSVELNPMDAGGHASLGFAYLKLRQDTIMSKIQFEVALRLDPKNADAYLGFGNLYEELGNVEKAIENYE
jgi:tetratricopeptide (TPR) repeat protein